MVATILESPLITLYEREFINVNHVFVKEW